MTKDELIERLADIEHQRWSDWQRWMHDKGVLKDTLCADGERVEVGLLLPIERVRIWERLIATPYAGLPEHSKQADRDQVMRYFPLIVEFVAGWIAANCPDYPDDLEGSWRKDMS